MLRAWNAENINQLGPAQKDRQGGSKGRKALGDTGTSTRLREAHDTLLEATPPESVSCCIVVVLLHSAACDLLFARYHAWHVSCRRCPVP